MKREEAYEYWRYKYEMAKDFDDPRWEGGEIREFRRYIDALATIVKMLEPPTCNADSIRQMTDEELTEYIRVFFPEVCPPGNCPGEDYCYKCWLDWLKSPVEADNG